MPINKSWIDMPQTSNEYLNGLKEFLKFAFERRSIEDKITCPCPKCGFRKLQTESVVFDHLVCKPFPKNYKTWVLHGESKEGVPTNASSSIPHMEEAMLPQDPMLDMINDAFGFSLPHSNEPSAANEVMGGDGVSNEVPNDISHIQELLKDGSQQLYEGCKKYTKLSFIVKLYHIKCLCRISDKAMTMIIELLRDAFEDAKLPISFYEAKKTINKLGLKCKKIHACPNDCMLYWDGTGDQDKQVCTRCNTSRWKDADKKQPAKVLRYFPLKPRLQRLFMCSKTAESMSWHKLEDNSDGLMRHPRDSEAWKKFDLTHTEFSSDPRNVRLGLATDGFNPFGAMSTNYSIWPVILIPYNRPPWECMKQTSFILSMIIPGKRMPGNDIDVYLQPLVKELNELWCDGVQTFDSSKNEMFRMRAALMWTISDFPGLGTLSGWNTYTGYACPTCNFDTIPCRLTHGKKYYFMGHRRFLSRRHKFRLNKGCFNGHVEERNPPIALSGADILKQVEGIEVTFGKVPDVEVRQKRPRRRCQQSHSHQWRKKSIFFNLPYWSSNLLRHNLDVMHIEKNICDNVVYTLLNDSKTKDDLSARKDLKEMGIRRDLWPDENGKCCPAVFTIPNKKKDPFFNTLKNVKVPDGYSSNISRCFEQKKISALKSHDCHILMEQLLPLAIRNVWPDNVTVVVVELCSFFRQLCGKSLNVEELDKLQQRIVLTLCHLEMLFPPSFFTVMVHLTCHLVDEAKLGGPVHYRWMYPIERYLGHLKSYVRNRAQPEGSIVECYLAEEALTFCSQYLEGIETRFNRQGRVNDYPCGNDLNEGCIIFPQLGKPVGKPSTFMLTPLERLQAHRYVLLNCPHVQPYVDEFRDFIKKRSRGRRISATDIEKRVTKEFADWFPQRIANPDIAATVPPILKSLGGGPMQQARRFTGFNINGFKFRTMKREEGLKTQNSGVFVTSTTSCVASSVDGNLREADLSYYGKLEDIIELIYGRYKVTLFKCRWADTTRDRGIQKDKWHFTSVNFSRLIHIGEREEHDPYIEASQAQMVYYVDDEINKGWSVVVHLKPRDLYDMGEKEEDGVYENEPFQEQDLGTFFDSDVGNIPLARMVEPDDVVNGANNGSQFPEDGHMSE